MGRFATLKETQPNRFSKEALGGTRFSSEALSAQQPIPQGIINKPSLPGGTPKDVKEIQPDIDTASFPRRIEGALVRGTAGVASSLLQIPKRSLLNKVGEIPEVAANFNTATRALKAAGFINEKISNSKFYNQMLEDHKRGMQAILKTHPEWESKPPEGFVDLLTSPDKLLVTLAESTPLLVAAGVTTVAGAPDVAFAMMYASEGQEAFDLAIADGATPEQAQTAYHAYGSVAAFLENLQLKGIMKVFKSGKRKMLLNRTTLKVAGKEITKDVVKTAAKEAAEEMAQQGWQETTAKLVYGKDPEGGWRGVVDRQLSAGFVGGTMGLLPGLGGVVAGSATTTDQAQQEAPVLGEAGGIEDVSVDKAAQQNEAIDAVIEQGKQEFETIDEANAFAERVADAAQATKRDVQIDVLAEDNSVTVTQAEQVAEIKPEQAPVEPTAAEVAIEPGDILEAAEAKPEVVDDVVEDAKQAKKKEVFGIKEVVKEKATKSKAVKSVRASVAKIAEQRLNNEITNDEAIAQLTAKREQIRNNTKNQTTGGFNKFTKPAQKKLQEIRDEIGNALAAKKPADVLEEAKKALKSGGGSKLKKSLLKSTVEGFEKGERDIAEVETRLNKFNEEASKITAELRKEADKENAELNRIYPTVEAKKKRLSGIEKELAKGKDLKGVNFGVKDPRGNLTQQKIKLESLLEEQESGKPIQAKVAAKKTQEAKKPVVAKKTPVKQVEAKPKAATAESIQQEPKVSQEMSVTKKTATVVQDAIKTDITDPTFPTSTKHDSTKEIRERLGIGQVNSKTRRSDEEAMSEAIKRKIPEKSPRIADEINAEPRALSDIEDAGMRIAVAELEIEHEQLMDLIGETTDEADIKTMSTEAQRVENELDSMLNALETSGSEAGRALRARRVQIGRDFKLTSVLNRAKAATGKKLTEVKRRIFKGLTKRLTTAEKEIVKLKSEVQELSAKKLLQRGAKRFTTLSTTQRTNTISQLANDVNILLKQGCAN